ncbi:MAG: hypothetical protein ACREVE_03770 [Gammaproteobacteria bacterium]
MGTLKRNIAALVMAALMPCQLFAAELPVSASDLPHYYPARFDGTGFLQAVEPSRNTLTIDALHYGLASNVPVHSLQTRFSSLSALRSGMEVGFTLRNGGRSDRRIITELWVLPVGSVVPH